MVRKSNSKRVWQKGQRKQKFTENHSAIIQEKSLQKIQQPNGQRYNSRKLSFQQSYELSQEYSVQNQEEPKRQVQVQRCKEQKVLQEEEYFFEITEQIISELKEQVYKNIVLAEFVQTNLTSLPIDHQQGFIQKHSELPQENNSVRKVKYEERQKITSFIFQSPLQIPKYYQQIKMSLQNQVMQKSKEVAKTEFVCKTLSKKNVLVQFNEVWLQASNIKYLNIYGPTGSGKTFTLKSIFHDNRCEESVIWINGMNIVKGRTKRFISDLKQRLDSLIWQIYQRKPTQKNICHDDFLKSSFDKRNQKVLVLDEYDQVSNFQLSDILRYSYIKQLQALRSINPEGQDNGKGLFFIYKVITISNTLSSSATLFQQYSYQHQDIALKKKILYIENIIFRPFTQKQAEQILKLKIKKINQNFSQYLSQHNPLKNIFYHEALGIFPPEKLKQIIKKTSSGSEIDIRKILLFYVDSLKKWIQSLQEIRQNFQTISQKSYKSHLQQNNPQKLARKGQNFLISQKFLLNFLDVNLSFDSNYQSFIIQDDSNPTNFYISQLQTEGKTILKAIYQQLMFNKRYKRNFHNEQDRQTNKNSCNKSDQKSKDEIEYLVSIEKRRQNTVRILDFHKRIKPKIQLNKIYPWIHEWQQIGLLKIRKSSSNRSSFEIFANHQNQKIKIVDNYQIQMNSKSIQKGLELY